MRGLLLLPLLLPLGAALLVGLLNLSTPARLRLLLWTSPSLSLGSWLILGAGSGALVGSAASLLAVGAAGAAARRQPADWASEPQTRSRPQRDAPGDRQPEAQAPTQAPAQAKAANPFSSIPWPARDPQEPAPTVSVPFRVVQRPQPAAAASTAATPAPAPASAPASAGGDWDETPNEDW